MAEQHYMTVIACCLPCRAYSMQQAMHTVLRHSTWQLSAMSLHPAIDMSDISMTLALPIMLDAVLWPLHIGLHCCRKRLCTLHVVLASRTEIHKCMSAGASMSYTLRGPVYLVASFLLAWLLLTASCCLLPTITKGTHFAVPFSPFTPSLSMLATLHLIGTDGVQHACHSCVFEA